MFHSPSQSQSPSLSPTTSHAIHVSTQSRSQSPSPPSTHTISMSQQQHAIVTPPSTPPSLSFVSIKLTPNNPQEQENNVTTPALPPPSPFIIQSPLASPPTVIRSYSPAAVSSFLYRSSLLEHGVPSPGSTPDGSIDGQDRLDTRLDALQMSKSLQSASQASRPGSPLSLNSPARSSGVDVSGTRIDDAQDVDSHIILGTSRLPSRFELHIRV